MYSYTHGCDGAGARCDNANCPTAFHKPDDTHVQVACQSNDVSSLAGERVVRDQCILIFLRPQVNLVITFCG